MAGSTSQTGPSTPSRASYQSPTKASLSRSHPTILADSPGRRGSEGRGKGLLQEVLLGKANTTNSGNRPPLPIPQTPQQHNDDDSDAAAGSPSPAPAESLSKAVTRAFVNHPAAPQLPRAPLRVRQPSTRNQDEGVVKPGQHIVSEPTSRFAAALPWHHDFPYEPISSAEPELPPTPTQLGLSPKPDRPRGLAASSSPNSRGSRRSKPRTGRVEISSPLKSKEKMPVADTEGVYREQTGQEGAEEAPESDIEQTEDVSPAQRTAEHSTSAPDLPGDTAAKHRIRASLKTQFARLQAETAQLESALSGGEEAKPLDVHLLALLSTPNISCDPVSPSGDASPSSMSLKDPVALDINPLAFLRAFAPGDLCLSTTTKTSSLRGKPHQAHILNISAPPPWPPHVFNATFRVGCDVEAKRVISITGANIRPRHGPGIRELRHWMEGRLKNPLHKFDAGTLIWGLGLWWEAAVARAHFFRHVDITKSSPAPSVDGLYKHNQPTKATDILSLLPYLGKSFVELIPAEPYSNRASTNEARKYRQPRLLLKWDLELDWAGEVHAEIGVAGAKVSAQGQEGVKKAFTELMRRNGLDVAVRQVVKLCGGV